MSVCHACICIYFVIVCLSVISTALLVRPLRFQHKPTVDPESLKSQGVNREERESDRETEGEPKRESDRETKRKTKRERQRERA